MKSFSAGQTVTIGEPGYTSSGGDLLLRLDDPTGFAGHVDLVEGGIALLGLVAAAICSF